MKLYLNMTYSGIQKTRWRQLLKKLTLNMFSNAESFLKMVNSRWNFIQTWRILGFWRADKLSFQNCNVDVIFFRMMVILDKWFIKKTILSAPYRSNHIPTACIQKEKNSWKSGGPTTVRFVFCCAPLRQLLSNGAATATKTEKYSCITVNYKHTKVVKYFLKPVN